MAFEFKWNFSFSDGDKVVERGDFIKSHENSADVDFVRVVSKCFTDTLTGVCGNRKDLAAWIKDEGVKVPKPFEVFPPELPPVVEKPKPTFKPELKPVIKPDKPKKKDK